MLQQVTILENIIEELNDLENMRKEDVSDINVLNKKVVNIMEKEKSLDSIISIVTHLMITHLKYEDPDTLTAAETAKYYKKLSLHHHIISNAQKIRLDFRPQICKKLKESILELFSISDFDLTFPDIEATKPSSKPSPKPTPFVNNIKTEESITDPFTTSTDEVEAGTGQAKELIKRLFENAEKNGGIVSDPELVQDALDAFGDSSEELGDFKVVTVTMDLQENATFDSILSQINTVLRQEGIDIDNLESSPLKTTNLNNPSTTPNTSDEDETIFFGDGQEYFYDDELDLFTDAEGNYYSYDYEDAENLNLYPLDSDLIEDEFEDLEYDPNYEQLEMDWFYPSTKYNNIKKDEIRYEEDDDEKIEL